MSTRRPSLVFDYCMERFQCMLGVLTFRSRPFADYPLPLATSSANDRSNSVDTSNDRSGGSSGRALGVEQRQSFDFLDLMLATLLAGFSSYVVSNIIMYLARRVADQEEQPPAASTYNRLYQILVKRGELKPKVPKLNSYERQMAEEIIDPDDIEASFRDIGGLDDTKREIYELAIMPLVQPELFTSKLAQPVKGILLYGKPGTGKTMLAKALAKEAQAVFLPLQLSKILNKWVGESNKLIAATFSLAHKVQPAIIFIDELDTFLKANNQETAYLDSIKAEFLTLWDGVATASSSRVLVLGATNKPQTIDNAILRRMPRAFHVPLPNRHGRLAILQLLLQDENVEPDVSTYLPQLALKTTGYSGSDLKELCKASVMVGIQELTSDFAKRRVNGETVDAAILQQKSGKKDSSNANKNGKASSAVTTNGVDEAKPTVRPVSRNDLEVALEKVKRTGENAHAYGEEEEGKQKLQGFSALDRESLSGLTTLLRSLSVLSLDKDAINGSNDIPNIV